MKVEKILETRLSDADRIFNYTYRLIKGQYEGIVSYGIEAEMNEVKDGQVVDIERDGINVISNNKAKVEKLLNILADNKVSPIHFIDVLGEYIDEYAGDFDIVPAEL
ncbi:MAG: DUF6514 family protein [Inconstantimicrobium porci]|uniref:Uncharacterized protein n=1 Tax=Inconstantimicrobium porci TaxID=2652291 RepID=A0A7X2MZ67_9CLOT|nr:DUF6514 family protein [Inconstantimicrobium porci]MDD6771736.1 DUF6514 family protein [Inconstantimicrobium porci]MDY5911556.1 DUF6514 family protein [Inconstantimicrobium porci]MSR91781.1 hypothetical protein [Inconstantimicrobium porci]